MALKDYKAKVHKIMTEVENSRNNDGVLIAHFIYIHCRRFLTKDVNDEWALPLKNLKHLPPFETIRRTRAIIQNDNNELLPTSEAVRKARGIKEANWTHCEVRESRDHVV